MLSNGSNAGRLLAALLLTALLGLPVLAMAEGRTFSANAVKKTGRPLPQGGWLDLSDVKPAKPQPAPAVYEPPPREKGIIGLDLRLVNGQYPIVQAVFRNSPAYLKGILPGDEIIAVDGVNAYGRSLSQVDAMISDVPGKKVEFVISRSGQQKRISVTVLGVDEMAANDFLIPKADAFPVDKSLMEFDPIALMQAQWQRHPFEVVFSTYMLTLLVYIMCGFWDRKEGDDSRRNVFPFLGRRGLDIVLDVFAFLLTDPKWRLHPILYLFIRPSLLIQPMLVIYFFICINHHDDQETLGMALAMPILFCSIFIGCTYFWRAVHRKKTPSRRAGSVVSMDTTEEPSSEEYYG